MMLHRVPRRDKSHVWPLEPESNWPVKPAPGQPGSLAQQLRLALRPRPSAVDLEPVPRGEFRGSVRRLRRDLNELAKTLVSIEEAVRA